MDMQKELEILIPWLNAQSAKGMMIEWPPIVKEGSTVVFGFVLPNIWPSGRLGVAFADATKDIETKDILAELQTLVNPTILDMQAKLTELSKMFGLVESTRAVHELLNDKTIVALDIIFEIERPVDTSTARVDPYGPHLQKWMENGVVEDAIFEEVKPASSNES